MNLLLLKYNNYFNRIIKKETTLDSYTSGRSFRYFSNVAFNPNDGVTAAQIINWSENWTPDYLIEFNDDNTIVSRWFILENLRTRNGQYRLSLRRDLIADNYNKITESTDVLIQKGYVGNDDPAVFNSEGLVFNQIKTKQDLLYDGSKCPWIVGYIPQDAYSSATQIDIGLNVTSVTPFKEYASQSEFEAAPYYRFIENNYYGYPTNIYLKANYKITDETIGAYVATYSYTNKASTRVGGSILQNNAFETYDDNVPIYTNVGAIKNNIIIPNSSYSGNTYLDEDALLSWNEKIVKVGSSTYYKILVKEESSLTETIQITGTNWTTVYNNITNVEKRFPQTGVGISFTSTSKIYRVYTLTISEDYNVTIPQATSRLHLNDQPYDMFAMPYSDVISMIDGSSSVTSDKELNMAVAQQIGAKSGSGNVYDVQLVPFCPFQEIIQADGTLNLTEANKTPIYDNQSTPTIQGYVIWGNKSTFDLNIAYNINITDYKQSNECDIYRLCSGNWAASFEFSPAKNGGGITGFEVECSYKPYSPYIHVSPIFKQETLYGGNYNDSRGLIYSGDLSIPQVSSTWANYQLSNKNYENIFNRQIQSMDVSNSIAQQQAILTSLAGGVSGTVSGAMSGAALGPIGAIVGAAGGATASAVGGVLDYNNMITQQEEQKSYAHDMYTYNLQNIQAIPQTITKLGALNKNNLVVPVLEYYTCTDEEKQMLANVIKYDGMTINRVGHITDFINDDAEYTFIQGKVLRLLDLNDDPHMCGEIYNEILKGVYL